MAIRIPDTFRALRHRPFRLFFVGQTISMAGTWMQSVALGWLVYRTTGSAFLLGATTFLGQIPTLLLAPAAGVWIDRWDRRRIVFATQLLSFAQAATLAAVVLAGRTDVEWILALALWLGVVSAVDLPARQSLLIDLVRGREDLPNAIALNSAMFNSARLVGPSLAGVLLAATGEGVVFLLNALSYLPLLVVLFAIRLARPPGAPSPRASAPDAMRGLADGFAYVAASRPLRSVLLNVALSSLLAGPYVVLMPILARDVLRGGPRTLGVLIGATGAGALVASFYVATRAHPARWRQRIAASGLLLGAALGTVSLAPGRDLALAALVLAGFANTTLLASSNTFLQTAVDDGKRGRVMSLYATAVSGIAPVGSLVAGSLAGALGAPRTLLACAAGSFLASALFLRLTRRGVAASAVERGAAA